MQYAGERRLKNEPNPNSVKRAIPIAICLADLHLTLIPPVGESEKSWWDRMRLTLGQIEKLTKLPSPVSKLPVICAGDIFNGESAKLINFGLEFLPRMYAVAGLQDLRGRQIKETAFGTLVLSDKIIPLESEKSTEIVSQGYPIRLHGFTCGFPIQPLKNPNDLLLEIAIVHEYAWPKGKQLPGDRDESSLKNKKKSFFGYDVVILGGNHTPFSIRSGGNGFPSVFNCGSLFPEKSQGKLRTSSVGTLYSDGSIVRTPLECK